VNPTLFRDSLSVHGAYLFLHSEYLSLHSESLSLYSESLSFVANLSLYITLLAWLTMGNRNAAVVNSLSLSLSLCVSLCMVNFPLLLKLTEVPLLQYVVMLVL